MGHFLGASRSALNFMPTAKTSTENSAGFQVTFATPVDASNYIPGFGIATGAMLWSIDYVSNLLRFSLIAQDGTVATQVNGITASPADQNTAAADIRAAVAATNA